MTTSAVTSATGDSVMVSSVAVNTGPEGPIGPQGLPGEDGTQGVVGPQGPIGLLGPQGNPGVQGDVGPTGAAGTDGIDGTNGIDGVDGTSVPAGGIALDVLQKVDGTDYNFIWAAATFAAPWADLTGNVADNTELQGILDTKLEASDVSITYETLDTAGDVGTGTGQLAIGDHGHVDMLVSGHIGVSVQGYDVNTAKTDVIQEYTATQNFDATVLSDSTNIAWDASLNQVCSVILAGNRTLDNPINMAEGATYVLKVKQDATGNKTLVYGTAYLWEDGIAPTLSTAANSVDILTFISYGGSMYGTLAKGFL